ncbi:hypothetical protein COCOBI_05-1540 [Coccomyxa sp. Obi]|nr:hypothetical protein COCOBI_05-1540 [Coccomyxa sp. Obi]
MTRRWWQHLRMRKARSRAGYAMQPTLPELPQAPPRSEAAKEAEAEQTAKHLKQQLPVGPQYLTRDDLVEAVKPSDAQMALCSLYCNRYYTQKRLSRASKKLGIPELTVYDQFEDKRVGLRMCTFTSEVHDLGDGVKVAAAVFALRGTRLTKAGTVQADIQLMKDRDAELYYSQRALKHVHKHIRRLTLQQPDVQWGFFTTGHSLGGFAACCCLILCDHILTCTAFESPGLTTFYHRLAAQKGDEDFWRARIVNYLAIPNPINMCQRHLGRIVRVHFPRLECRTDATHLLRCALGTGVRVLNWGLAASAGVSALCLAAGISRSALICRMIEAWASECALEVAVPPVAASAYWSLHSAAAMVATRLGTTLRYILQQHSMWHMAQAFDPMSGGPRQCIEMESWPRMERMTETFGATVGRALLESFYATASTEGLSVIFNRTAMVEARIRRLPGYVPARSADFDDAASDGGHSAFLWRLGDAFELWEDQGEVMQKDAEDLSSLTAQGTTAAVPDGSRDATEDSELSGVGLSGFSAEAEAAGGSGAVPSMFSPSPFERAGLTGYDSDDEGETVGRERAANASAGDLSGYDECSTTDAETRRRPLTRSCSHYSPPRRGGCLGARSSSAFVLGDVSTIERRFFDKAHDSELLDVSGLDPETDADGAGRSADESSRQRSLIRRHQWPTQLADDSTSGAEGLSTADEAWHKPYHHRASSDSILARTAAASSHGAPSAQAGTSGQSDGMKLGAAVGSAVDPRAEECAGIDIPADEPGYVTESEAGEMTGVDAELDEGPSGKSSAVAAAAVAADAPAAAAGGWFRRPMLWAGVKRGIRRRAVPS